MDALLEVYLQEFYGAKGSGLFGKTRLQELFVVGYLKKRSSVRIAMPLLSTYFNEIALY